MRAPRKSSERNDPSKFVAELLKLTFGFTLPIDGKKPECEFDKGYFLFEQATDYNSAGLGIALEGLLKNGYSISEVVDAFAECIVKKRMKPTNAAVVVFKRLWDDHNLNACSFGKAIVAAKLLYALGEEIVGSHFHAVERLYLVVKALCRSPYSEDAKKEFMSVLASMPPPPPVNKRHKAGAILEVPLFADDEQIEFYDEFMLGDDGGDEEPGREEEHPIDPPAKPRAARPRKATCVLDVTRLPVVEGAASASASATASTEIVNTTTFGEEVEVTS